MSEGDPKGKYAPLLPLLWPCGPSLLYPLPLPLHGPLPSRAIGDASRRADEVRGQIRDFVGIRRHDVGLVLELQPRLLRRVQIMGERVPANGPVDLCQ